MIPCDMRKTTAGLGVSVKDARLHLAVPFDLHEQPAGQVASLAGGALRQVPLGGAVPVAAYQLQISPRLSN